MSTQDTNTHPDGRTDSNTSLTVREQAPAATDVTIRDPDASPAKIARQLFAPDALGGHVLGAIKDVVDGATPGDARERLREAGVDALEGHYTTVATNAAGGSVAAESAFLQLTETLGDGRPDGLRSTLEDVHAGPIAALAAADRTPTVAVHLGEAFREARRDHREGILRLLVELSRGAHVDLVTGPIGRRFLATRHGAELPRRVQEACRPRLDAPAPEDVEETVAEARQALDADGPAVAMLRQCRETASEAATYSHLVDALSRDRSTVRYHVGRLREHDLAERVDRRGEAAISLSGVGETFLDTLDAEIGVQRGLSESVEATGNASHNSRGSRTPTGDPPARSGGRRSSRCDGFHTTEEFPRFEQDAVGGASPDGGFALIDTPIDQLEDAGTRLWAYDRAEREVYLGAEYMGPLQYWTSFALSSADWRTFEQVLDEDRLDTVFQDVGEAILRDARNIGGLTDEALEDPATFKERIDEWREDLIDMTRKLRHDEYETEPEAFRAAILRSAHGLAGTLVHLLDEAGITVRRVLRLPDLRRHFDRSGNADRRNDLLRTIAVGTAIQSEFKSRTAYRLLYETRDEVRERGFGVDLSDTPPEDCVGRMAGSFAIIGPDVSDLEEELRTAIENPAELHDDAPEIAVEVPVATTFGEDAYRETVKRACRAKNLTPTDTAVSMLQALTGSPYDATRAIHRGLSREDRRRDLRLNEVRRALAFLEPDAILPDAAPTVRKVVHALLAADEPLTRQALADRADVSTRSVRNHAERLEAFDFVRETPEGLRFTLPFTTDEERWTGLAPWYATPAADRDDHREASIGGVLLEALEHLVDDPSRFGDTGDPVYRATLGETEAMREEFDLGAFIDAAAAIATRADAPGEDPVTVQFGDATDQVGIEAVTTAQPGTVP